METERDRTKKEAMKAILSVGQLLLVHMTRISEDLLCITDSDSEEEDIISYFVNPRRLDIRRCIPRIEIYVDEVVASFTRAEFKANFREKKAILPLTIPLNQVYYISKMVHLMTFLLHFHSSTHPKRAGQIHTYTLYIIYRMFPETYRHILSKIEGELRPKKKGTPMIAAHTQFLLTLWRLGTPDSFRSICERFGVGRSTAFYITTRVVTELVKLSSAVIKWPAEERVPEVWTGFELIRYLGDITKFPQDSHLVGDLAYTLHSNLLTPYHDNGHLTDREKNYNFCQSSARIAIERAFGLLKNRFRCLLDTLPVNRVQFIPRQIMACCVLHNLCLMREDELDVEWNENAITFDSTTGDENDDIAAASAAAIKRDLICQNLIMREV